MRFSKDDAVSHGRSRYLCVLICLAAGTVSASDNWPQWRGPQGTGSISLQPTAEGPPTAWSDTENVAWLCPLPGRGHSTPVVHGKHVFVTAAVAVGPSLAPRMSGRPGAHDNLPVTSRYEFVVFCVDRNTGEIRWQRTLHDAVPIEGGHVSASLASASPVTDGQYVYALFGSHGLFCLDMQGQLVWEKQLGQMHTKHGHGEGASPVLHGQTLVVNWDHEDQSFVVALDSRSGQEIWRRNREEVTSWSSPLVVDVAGVTQLIVCGTSRVRGYDLATGDVLWECGGLSANIVASPVYDSKTGILVVGSSYEIRKLMAIDLHNAAGDVTDTDHVLWSRTRGTPYVPSLMLANGGVYFLAHYQNILTRVSVRDGTEAPGPMRLGYLGNIYASPVSDGRHVYVTDLEGTTMVITASETPKLISVNRLNEPVNASAAISGSQMLIRTTEALYCLGKPSD